MNRPYRIGDRWRCFLVTNGWQECSEPHVVEGYEEQA